MSDATGAFIAASVAAAVVVVIGFLAAIFGAAVGAIIGFLVGITPLGGMIVQTFEVLGFPGIVVMNLGATLGFIGGFLVSRVNVQKEE